MLFAEDEDLHCRQMLYWRRKAEVVQARKEYAGVLAKDTTVRWHLLTRRIVQLLFMKVQQWREIDLRAKFRHVYAITNTMNELYEYADKLEKELDS